MILRNTSLMLAVVVATTGWGFDPTGSPEALELDGSAVVFSISSEDGDATDLLIMVDEQHGVADAERSVDRMFRLQIEGAEFVPMELQLEGVEVRWSSHDVRLVQGGEEVLGVGVGELEEEVDVKGFGLIQLAPGEVEFPRLPLSQDRFEQLRDTWSETLYGETCICADVAGGPGALSSSMPTGSCPGSPSGCGPVACEAGFSPCCGCTDETQFACCVCAQPN